MVIIFAFFPLIGIFVVVNRMYSAKESDSEEKNKWEHEWESITDVNIIYRMKIIYLQQDKPKNKAREKKMASAINRFMEENMVRLNSFIWNIIWNSKHIQLKFVLNYNKPDWLFIKQKNNRRSMFCLTILHFLQISFVVWTQKRNKKK